jgi:hypothetical protein
MRSNALIRLVRALTWSEREILPVWSARLVKQVRVVIGDGVIEAFDGMKLLLG